MQKIAILGSGSFGCAIAYAYSNAGYDISLWSYDPKEIADIKTNHENIRCLPGIKIPASIHISSDITEIFDSNVIFIAVPSHAVRTTISLLKSHIKSSTIIVCLSKGLEESSLKLLSQVIQETLPNNQYAILSGPSHAEEIAKNITTALVISSKNIDIAKYIQKNFCTPTIRIYINNDIIGVQIGAALKNIIALAIGICDGMELGDNTKAALMTRGLSEISKLGLAMGAKKDTFSGLSGIGDLIVTCTSLHSRNRRAGFFIGQGIEVKEAIKKVGMIVEGYTCTKCAYNLGLKYHVELPIINEIYDILYNNKDLHIALKNLFTRPYKDE